MPNGKGLPVILQELPVANKLSLKTFSKGNSAE